MALPFLPIPSIQHQSHLCSAPSTFINIKTSFTLNATTAAAVRGKPVQIPQGQSQAYNSHSAIVAEISALCRGGRMDEAVDVLRVMDQRGITIGFDIYAYLLQACANVKALAEGKRVHAHMVINSVEKNLFLAAKLVTMYSMCGSLVDARLVFDDVPKRHAFLWNAMLKGYVRNELWEDTLCLYSQMQWAGSRPDNYTFSSALKACAALSNLRHGQEIHGHLIRGGFEFNLFVGNALVTMYARCARVKAARQVFEKMPERDVVSWTAIIAGYAQGALVNEALRLFREMLKDGVKPNSVTVTSALPACARLAALCRGTEIHGHIIRMGLESCVFVESALVDVYAQCGSIDVARQLFDKMSERNVVSWTVMIAGYGMNGHGEDALKLFKQMQQEGLKPNHITFVVILSACSHAGLVAEGWQYFNSMSCDYHITPTLEHYACMVDLLGRAGRLDEAEDFIQKMPLYADASVWGALLGACRIHFNVKLAERVAEHLFEFEPRNSGNCILLADIYAMAGMWDEVAKVRTMMKERELKTKQGCSWIEINSKVHAFHVRDRSHPQSEEIYAMLEWLAAQMKEAGYVPATNSSLYDG